MWHWPGMNRWRGWLRGWLVLLLLGGSPAGATPGAPAGLPPVGSAGTAVTGSPPTGGAVGSAPGQPPAPPVLGLAPKVAVVRRAW